MYRILTVIVVLAISADVGAASGIMLGMRELDLAEKGAFWIVAAS